MEVSASKLPWNEFAETLSKLSPRTDEEIRQWEWENVVLGHLEASKLPFRYRHQRTEWHCRPQKRVFEVCKELFTGKGAIVALVGPRGVGKTEIAAQLIIERALDSTLLPWHRRPPYRKLTDLIAKWKAVYSDFGSIDSEYWIRRRDSFCLDHPFVVIDEIHDCNDQRAKDRILTDVIDRRYSAFNDTLLISNQLASDFEQSVGDSVMSRLEQHGKLIECKWSSFRTPAA